MNRRQDTVSMTNLFKVLEEIAFYLDPSLVEILLQKLRDVPYDEYNLQHLDLLKELTRYNRTLSDARNFYFFNFFNFNLLNMLIIK